MMKLICTKCGEVWYTSNESDNQLCDNCKGKLEKVKYEPLEVETSKKYN